MQSREQRELGRRRRGLDSFGQKRGDEGEIMCLHRRREVFIERKRRGLEGLGQKAWLSEPSTDALERVER